MTNNYNKPIFYPATLILVLLCLVALLTGCRPENTPLQKSERSGFYMDTLVDIIIFGPKEAAEEGIAAAFREFARIDKLLNYYDEKSELSQINQNSGRSAIVSAETARLIAQAIAVGEKSKGGFDITIAPLVDLWGFPAKPRVPAPGEIEQVLPQVDYRQVQLDGEKLFLPQGMKIDLSGAAKGYAVDSALASLRSHGITSAIVNAGGNVGVIGQRPDGSPWQIGVENPLPAKDQLPIIAVISASDTCIATSGISQRNLTVDNRLYHHLLDPATGYPADRLAAATVICQDGGLGDMLATAVFILGQERGFELLQEFPGVEGLVVGLDGQVVTTPGLAPQVKILPRKVRKDVDKVG